jgi:hypothetical protein
VSLKSTTFTEAEYHRAARLTLRYLRREPFINNSALRDLTGLNYDQAIHFFSRIVSEGALRRIGKAAGTRYIVPDTPDVPHPKQKHL